MPILGDWLAIGLVAISAVVLVKVLVLSTPVKNIPGLGAYLGVA